MKYARLQRFAERCRKLSGKRGCRECKKVLPQGLFLVGQPSLSEMARAGTPVGELKTAMRERGWYCRGCVNRRKRVYGATTTSLRDQFATQEEYYAYLEKHRPPPPLSTHT